MLSEMDVRRFVEEEMESLISGDYASLLRIARILEDYNNVVESDFLTALDRQIREAVATFPDSRITLEYATIRWQ
ncbi:hypothetical protein COT69_02185 [candidate division WWE3 bacterium CG09_land_8_20_14_0_10_39_24]|uniref:Uncharacterized protein n=2 Tax=Katanobacteria TaxID=422282 RepID=A0A2G9XCR6_UNCKA|nr:MAG: hypothetical protein AUJ94_00625 [bacterium CG2_30_40_12]PIP04754.1 MAG: hypothetical protein COX53_00700 [candidate division WWE3 bacterium CG23_combo_of_CG06-09_8_20_14_all_40_14]PIS12807.1 MAG: hypothetical protein COT69_02185 [candidate division WWE3 bacterium CG09_land_8_20_14_0_10_39_24]PJE50801.1 MAG: hypothetical protein COV27_02565 [candidate division WWE3 bacterium CG10_big_fil_rev_8_21_14_0_10_39_14]